MNSKIISGGKPNIFIRTNDLNIRKTLFNPIGRTVIAGIINNHDFEMRKSLTS
jgi:hypothetical protein